MRFIIRKTIFMAALDKTFAVAARSVGQGILQQVYCRSMEDGKLQFIGSDQDLTVISDCAAVNVDQPGDTTFPPRFREMVRNCAEEDIVVETDEDTINLSCGGYHATIRTDRDEYPFIEVKFEQMWTIPKDVIVEALRRVRSAASVDAARPNFQFIQLDGTVMRATDTFKLHQLDFPFGVRILLPTRTAAEILSRARKMSHDTVGIQETPSKLIFRFDDDDLLISQKFNIEYPDVVSAMITPTNGNRQKVTFGRRDLIEAIRRCAVTADQDTNYMSITLDHDKMLLMTLDKYGETSTETILVKWAHPRRTLGVNWQFLTEILSAMSEPQVSMHIGSDNEGPRPSMLRFEEKGFIAVLTQLRADLGEAAKGSDRVRPAQSAPTGWGIEGGSTAHELEARKRGQLVPDDEEEGRQTYLENDEKLDLDKIMSVGDTDPLAPPSAEPEGEDVAVTA